MRQLMSIGLIVILFSFNALGKVMVFPFENMTTDNSLNWLGTALEITIEDSLDSIPYYKRLQLLESMDLPEHSEFSLATKIVLAEKAGAKLLVEGSFSLSDDKLSIHTEIYDVKEMKKQELEMMASFEELPLSVKPLIVSLKGQWKYSEALNSHYFEKYIKGWILAINNDDFNFIEQVIDKTGGFDTLFRNVGYMSIENENYLYGFNFFSKLVETDYSDLFYTAVCAIGIEDFEVAKVYFEKAMSLSERKELFYNIAGCLHEMKRDNEALFYLNNLEEDLGNVTPEFYYNKALIHASLKQFDKSLDLIQDFITQYKITEYAEDLIKYCCEGSDISHSLCNLIQETEDPAEFLPDFHFIENPGEYKETVSLPAIKHLYFQNAKTCIEIDNMDKAREYLEKILIFEPNNPEILTLLCDKIKIQSACDKLKKIIPISNNNVSESD